MKIQIEEYKQLGEVQAEFSRFFPELSLEFFRRGGDGQVPDHLLDTGLKIGEVTFGLQEGAVGLNDGMTAAEVEEIFNERFGLHVTVMRSRGKGLRHTPLAGCEVLKH